MPKIQASDLINEEQIAKIIAECVGILYQAIDEMKVGSETNEPIQIEVDIESFHNHVEKCYNVLTKVRCGVKHLKEAAETFEDLQNLSRN